MAWFSLFIVILIFFIPGIGLCQSIIKNNIDWIISLGFYNLPITIPLTGPLKLIFFIGLVWLGIWLFLSFLTFRFEKSKIPLQQFFRRALISTRPQICLNTPTMLAKATLLLAGIKIVFYLLFIITKNFVPLLTENTSLAKDGILSWLINFITQGIDLVNNFSSTWLLSAVLLSFLIIVVNRVSNWEKNKLIRQNTQFILQKQKNNQTKINIPANQL